MQVMNKTRAFTASAKAKTAALVAIATAAAASAPAAFAQSADPATDIIAKVNSSLASGELIAAAVVLGIFAIWGIKLLLKGK